MESTENQLCPTCGMPMNEGDHNHESTPEAAPAAPAEGGTDAGMGGGEAAPQEAAPAQPETPDQPEAPASETPAEGENTGM